MRILRLSPSMTPCNSQLSRPPVFGGAFLAKAAVVRHCYLGSILTTLRDRRILESMSLTRDGLAPVHTFQLIQILRPSPFPGSAFLGHQGTKLGHLMPEIWTAEALQHKFDGLGERRTKLEPTAVFCCRRAREAL